MPGALVADSCLAGREPEQADSWRVGGSERWKKPHSPTAEGKVREKQRTQCCGQVHVANDRVEI